MLLDGERSGVKGETKDLNGGDDAGPETEEGEGDELGDDARDGDGGISEEEELVQAGDEDGPAETDDPCAEGVDGHVGVVCVGDGGPDFRVRGVVLEGVDMVEVEVGVLKVGNGDVVRDFCGDCRC